MHALGGKRKAEILPVNQGQGASPGRGGERGRGPREKQARGGGLGKPNYFAKNTD